MDEQVIELERLRFHIRQYITKEKLAAEMDLKLVADHVGGVLVRATAELLGQRLCKDVHTVRVPAPDGRWQALKMALLPKWALRRWPIRTVKREVRFTRHALYPELSARFPDTMMVIREGVQERGRNDHKTDAAEGLSWDTPL